MIPRRIERICSFERPRRPFWIEVGYQGMRFLLPTLFAGVSGYLAHRISVPELHDLCVGLAIGSTWAYVWRDLR